jgi:hypothetical protein
MTARNNHCCCLVKFLKSPLSNCGADGHGFYYTKQNKHPQFLMIGEKNITFFGLILESSNRLDDRSIDDSCRFPCLSAPLFENEDLKNLPSRNKKPFLLSCFFLQSWEIEDVCFALYSKQPHSLSNIGSWGNMYQTVSPITTNLILGEG